MSARLKTSGPAGVTRRFVFLPWLSGGRQASLVSRVSLSIIAGRSHLILR